MKAFVVSDFHLNHFNIIKYCHRPFKDVAEMNKTIIDNWNSVVSDDDIVYFLGDFCLGNADDVKKFASQLKGHKYIIRGNHDGKANIFTEAGFEVLPAGYKLMYKGHEIIFTHRPLVGTKRFNVHGHIHQRAYDDKHLFNASVERIYYTPIELDEVIKHDPTYND